jgi:hypothetical protein
MPQNAMVRCLDPATQTQQIVRGMRDTWQQIVWGKQGISENDSISVY